MNTGSLTRARLLIGLCVLCGWAGVSLAALPEPLAYYPLDGSGNELTGRNIDLNPIGEPTYVASMVSGLGQALSLDGVNDALVGSAFVYSTTGAITLSAWVKLQAPVYSSIFKNWAGPPGQFHFGIEPDLRLKNFVSVDPPAGQPVVSAPSSFPVGVWTHVAVVVNPATHQQRLFINANLVATASFPGTLTTNPTCLGLGIGVKPSCDGTATGGPAAFWYGQLDEVAAWDQSLTDAQISEIYALGLAGSTLRGSGRGWSAGSRGQLSSGSKRRPG